jgi:hypothetical protein
MSTTPIQQDYHYQVDQQVSVNAFFEAVVEGETVKFQVTSRYGSTPDKIVKTTEAAIEAYKALRAAYPLPERPAFIPAPQEPIHQPIDDGGNGLPEVKHFTAERMSVEMKDEKYYYKVIGKPFTQYGVTVWPEVLEDAGLDVTPGQPVPNIAGWRADYIEALNKNNKMTPQKVTRLLPPK